VVYIKAGGAVLFMAICGAIGYWLLCVNQRLVEFFIATESEMKKVNWSSKKEIMGSTWVVIGVTVFLAVLCFVCDTLFAKLFQLMKVLEL
jgi:preprotein translocase subunit SecE